MHRRRRNPEENALGKDHALAIKTNSEVSENFHRELDKRLGLTADDETGQLEKVINSIEITPQPRAIPLSVMTRGVGTTTSIFYSRVETTWNLQAIEEIATIHQVYRVCTICGPTLYAR